MRRFDRATLIGLAGVAVVLGAIVGAYDRVFTETWWRWPALAAAGSAMVIVVGLRVLRRGGLLVAFVSALALLTLAPWLVGIAHRPMMPGPTSLFAVGALLSEGLVQLDTARSPTVPFDGLMLVVIGAWWIFTHAAVDIVMHHRRPGLALIPLTVLWASPLVADQSGRNWPVAMVFMIACALMLLATRSARETSGLDTSAVGRLVPASGVKLAAVAIVVGAVAPGALPGYGERGWVSLGSSSGRGYEAIVDVTQRLGLSQPRDLMRVQLSQRTYLRIAGLDVFDGEAWLLRAVSDEGEGIDRDGLRIATDPLPFEESAGRAQPVWAEVELLDYTSNFLPVPYHPALIDGPSRGEMGFSRDGGFVAMLDMFDDRDPGQPVRLLRSGLTYRVQALRPTPTLDDLKDLDYSDEILAAHTGLPRDYAELGAIAEQVYAAAGATNSVEKALALQDWFSAPDGSFTYAFDVPSRGDDLITEFVLEHRTGYCVQFASAMAIMLRQTGIPARVAVGFLPGRITGSGTSSTGMRLTEFTVSTADAHAWVEVLFPRFGWVAFEPTPRSDGTQIVPTLDSLAPVESLRERQTRELGGSTQWIDDLWEDDLLDGEPFLGAGADGTLDDQVAAGVTPARPPWWMLVVSVVGSLVLVMIAAWQLRGLRGLVDATAQDRILVAQRGLLRSAASYGLARRPHETLAELIARWRAEGRQISMSASGVAAVQAAAFGGAADDATAERVTRDVQATVIALRRSIPRRALIVAPVRLPSQAALRRVRRAGHATRHTVRRVLVNVRRWSQASPRVRSPAQP